MTEVGQPIVRRAPILTLLALTACSGDASGPLPGNMADAGRDAPATHTGTLDDGAAWVGELPADWNGTLLLYAHGYNRELQPPKSAPDEIHDALLDAGYALAASAYPTAEWAVAEAVPSQVLAIEAFADRYGKPERVIAWGSSMGGLVTSALAERHAGRIDGALTLCASSMGAVPMMNMALDGALALATLVPADPPVGIAGHGNNMDGVERQMAAVDAARETPAGRARVALAGVLGGIPSWTRPDRPRPDEGDHAAQEEEIAAAVRWGLFLPRGDQESRAGGIYSWNTGIDYGVLLGNSGREELVTALYEAAGLDLDADLATLNAMPRVEADAAAVDYMLASYTPTGDVGVPVLSMHTIGDGMTSPFLQASYVDKIRRAGKGELVAALWIERAGHCTQTAAEMLAALGVLEARLDTGEWQTDRVVRNGAANGGDTRFIEYSAPPMPRAAAGYAERSP